MRNKWFRILAPAAVILIWLAVAGIGGPLFGKISGVTKNDQASFLPASAESTKAQEIQNKFYESDTIPAIIIIESSKKLQPQDFETLAKLVPVLHAVEGVAKAESAVAGPIPSEDGMAVEFIVQIDKSGQIETAVEGLRTTLSDSLDSSYTSYVTGPAGFITDLFDAFSGIDGILLVVALAAVFIILLLVYRSILLPFIVLITSIFALSGAILLVYQLAIHDVIILNGQSQGILSILVIGAATDYALLFIARYKEALHQVESKWDAILRAYKGSLEPIAASSATVIAALLCLLFSDLNSNKSLGPIATAGIVFAFISAMTLLPAILVSLGRNAFWPRMPQHDNIDAIAPTSIWGRVGHLIKAHPRRVWIICVVVLGAAALGTFQFKAEGISQADTILTKSNAVDGQAALSRHFLAGSGSPTAVIVDVADVSQAMQILTSIDDVDQTSIFTGGSPLAQLPPKIVDGKILINATLSDSADSSAATESITLMREKFNDASLDVLVGGQSAIKFDTNTTATNDLFKIVPIVLIVILLILIVLLRSILSAVILIGTVILSYFSALGVSALVFNHLFNFPGSDPAVPLFSFIFLVALGVDYNIFLMTRVHEESKTKPTREAIIHSLQVTGGVITSAGVVLAATFAALSVIPILFLAQIAFIVSFGVLLDTIVVRSLLLSSLTYDLGSNIWWPARRWRKE